MFSLSEEEMDTIMQCPTICQRKAHGKNSLDVHNIRVRTHTCTCDLLKMFNAKR